MKQLTNYKVSAKCLRCGVDRLQHEKGQQCHGKVLKQRHLWSDGNHDRCRKIYSDDELKFKSLFKNIRYRCDRIKNKDYHRYGGAGIKFLWSDYDAFRKDMYEEYLSHKKVNKGFNTTIERLDNKGHYCKENCVWATWKIQSRNRSQNVFITYKGESLCNADWAKKLGCSRAVINYRVKAGWTPEQIIETKINHGNGHKKYSNKL